MDARSDIFSFGSVLYEMLTGQRAFQGETRLSTLSAIVNKDPKPVSEILEGSSGALEGIVSLCLRKDPRRRLQHIDDVLTLLQELKQECESGKPVSRLRAEAPRTSRWGHPSVMGAGLVLLAVIAGLTWWRPWVAATPQFVFTRLTADSGLATDPALSPDGKLLAYASDRSGEGNLDIWVQHLIGGEAMRLTPSAADEREPVFSPDASKIAYRSVREGGGVYVMAALGGEARLIAREGREDRKSVV